MVPMGQGVRLVYPGAPFPQGCDHASTFRTSNRHAPTGAVRPVEHRAWVALTGGAPARAVAGPGVDHRPAPPPRPEQSTRGRREGSVPSPLPAERAAVPLNPDGQGCVQVLAAGFLGGEPVLVREFRRPGWQVSPAGRRPRPGGLPAHPGGRPPRQGRRPHLRRSGCELTGGNGRHRADQRAADRGLPVRPGGTGS